MNKTKIILDRPNISSGSIIEKQNFDELLANHKIMSKPFYKNAWFYGVSGMASISLLAGSYYFTGNSIDEPSESNLSLAMASPPLIIKGISKETEEKEVQNELKNSNDLNIGTVKVSDVVKSKDKELNQVIVEEVYQATEVKTELKESNIVSDKKEKHLFSFFDLHPRISGKVNGSISKQELLDDKGLVTNSDVKIVEFELHIVDGVGGKVFDGSGNNLTTDMKTAIEKVNVGEEIYFENIKGLANSGDLVVLSPLRYVLLN
jgi:hypothetical protein